VYRAYLETARTANGNKEAKDMGDTLNVVRVALYARVSTTDKGQDPEMQLRELREYAQRRGWKSEVFVDRTSSAKLRPELERLRQLCRGRKFDVVLVYRFDRFARSMPELINALQEFNVLGIQFVSLHEHVDTTTPQGRLVFGIFAAIAEFERDLIRERVRSGLANAKAKGKKLGRPRTYVDLDQVATLRTSGASWRAIAEELGVGVGTVHRIAQKRAKTLCGSFGKDGLTESDEKGVICT
jgi:DNA invertase Pin-like site-specific DNA recombinase